MPKDGNGSLGSSGARFAAAYMHCDLFKCVHSGYVLEDPISEDYQAQN